MDWSLKLFILVVDLRSLRPMQINIEKNREEYSNEAERGTERGMRYLYTLTASKIHLLLERDFVVV